MKKSLVTGTCLLLAVGGIAMASTAMATDLVPGKADQAPKALKQTAFVRGDASSKAKRFTPPAASAKAGSEVPVVGALIVTTTPDGRQVVSHEGDVSTAEVK